MKKGIEYLKIFSSTGIVTNNFNFAEWSISTHVVGPSLPKYDLQKSNCKSSRFLWLVDAGGATLIVEKIEEFIFKVYYNSFIECPRIIWIFALELQSAEIAAETMRNPLVTSGWWISAKDKRNMSVLNIALRYT